MATAILRFRWLRAFGSILIYYVCNAFAYKLGYIVDHFFYSSMGTGFVPVALSIIVGLCWWLALLAICALWYFAGAEAGAWEGAILAIVIFGGIVFLATLENEVRMLIGLPVEILHVGEAALQWVPFVLLFAAFGAKYRQFRSHSTGVTHSNYYSI
ncbi:hypothetical protein [Bradyrhizobium sp. CCBAU 53338]|uniref:hypothetical protein n=1 Tax=Bradyrhizobium sp. CCBAU 53338 TaxID=1325111 RepID=UPI00188C89D1|nr:hypothetical protein [Bradyrhizobium sp. CCBAU 53338]QOZ50526.1 hypothetical protein XH90_03500 [Bradyrhizobium sp. CCBAU 53338]